jgi:hypothetical protein
MSLGSFKDRFVRGFVKLIQPSPNQVGNERNVPR